MIIHTTYRDLPWEDVRKCQIPLDDAYSGNHWETQLRGKPVAIETPPATTHNPMIVCSGPYYRKVSPDGYSSLVCVHIAVIGD